MKTTPIVCALLTYSLAPLHGAELPSPKSDNEATRSARREAPSAKKEDTKNTEDQARMEKKQRETDKAKKAANHANKTNPSEYVSDKDDEQKPSTNPPKKKVPSHYVSVIRTFWPVPGLHSRDYCRGMSSPPSPSTQRRKRSRSSLVPRQTGPSSAPSHRATMRRAHTATSNPKNDE